jgi:hypothetical protein
MNDFGDLPKPETKEWSLESWGLILRDSASLAPDIFPYKVSILKNSTFFRTVYERVYRGKGPLVAGSYRRIRPRGIMVEHEATLGVNDLGEVMVSREVFEGDMSGARTKINDPEYQKHIDVLRSIPMPLGWRTFGVIHSHPVEDIANELVARFEWGTPRVNDTPLTWSGGDFNGFIICAKDGYRGFTTLGYINPNLLSFMVASSLTVESLNKLGKNLKKLERHPTLEAPPYERFKNLGIILYAGVHNEKRSDRVLLERLI